MDSAVAFGLLRLASRLARWALVVGLGLAVAVCNGGVDGKRIEQSQPEDWLTYGRTYSQQRFSPLNEINEDTVKRLGVAWWAELDTDRGQEATPLIADGVLYTTTAWSRVYAFDAKSGKTLWQYDPKVPGEKGFNACCDIVNRGAALWGGYLYIGTIDGRLIALEAATGKLVWSVQTTDPEQPYTITGAPLAVKGEILIGNGGAEYPVRGYLSAYDALTGKLAWRFYMTPNPKGGADGAASDPILKRLADSSWSEGAWTLAGGGGTPWDGITYDSRTDLVFVGTGNAAPWSGHIRTGGKGDNLFAASIVALRPETGEYVWHYQTTPRDDWDFDAVQQIMVADLPIGGKSRHVLMQANKNGFFYVLDAASGKLISADNFVPVTWAERIDLASGRPVESPGVRYSQNWHKQTPGALGGHNWQPMAFSPHERLVYIPAHNLAMDYADSTEFKFVPGAWNTGLSHSDPPAKTPADSPVAPQAFGQLIAWDPTARKARWKLDFPQLWHGGVLATAGGLVFHAAGHDLVALNAASGTPLWAYDVGATAIAAPSTYSIAGVQYVALLVGYGGAAFGPDNPRRPGRLFVFKLDGKAVPTPFLEPVVTPPLDVGGATPSKGDVVKGATLYKEFCATCHDGGGFLPILDRSSAILHPTGFRHIVLNGSLKQFGMAPFRRFFDADSAEDIRAYLLDQAKSPPAAPPQGELKHAH